MGSRACLCFRTSVTEAEIETILTEMHRETLDPEILVLGPRTSLVCAAKLD
jgi:hypothetical protein